MINFMGTTLGTIEGKPFIASRLIMPHYPSVQRVQPDSRHFRYLLDCQYGRFVGPFIHFQEIEEPGWLRLRCKPILLNHFLQLSGVSVIDYANQQISRPDFSLPWEVGAGELCLFDWRIKCLSMATGSKT